MLMCFDQTFCFFSRFFPPTRATHTRLAHRRARVDFWTLYHLPVTTQLLLGHTLSDLPPLSPLRLPSPFTFSFSPRC